MKPPFSALNFNFLKLAAMLCMTADHVNLLLLGHEVQWLFVVGRMAMPLFSFLAAYHLLFHTRDAAAYLRRLAFFAILAQFPYLIFLYGYGFNIFFTLLLGLLPLYVWHQTNKVGSLVGAMLAVGLFAGLSEVFYGFSYGLIGVMLGVSVGIWLKTGLRTVLALCLLLLWFLNPTFPTNLGAYGAIALIGLATIIRYPFGFVRRFGALWYWYYPGHIVFLGVLSYVMC